ncbi:putative uncharacterized protein [Prevotella sp. CAG:1058]|jgi:hypothetical protein|nr:putative uncharacterized protein [Prevotella sp. CAG:1058]
MKKTAVYLLLFVLLLASCTGGNKAENSNGPTDSVPVMVMHIRKCSKLYTAEYKVRKIVTHDDKVELNGSFLQQKFNISVPMSSRKIAIPIDAKLKAYVDFSGFSEKNIRTDGDKVEIILPDPKVELTSTRIGHSEVKSHVSLFRSNFTDAEMAEYERQGRETIIKSIPKLGIIDMARAGATHALVPILTRLGYKEENITITFRKDFTTEDLPLLLENNTIENGRQ